MKHLLKLTLFAAFIFSSNAIYSQNDFHNEIMQNINSHLNKGDCEDAQKAYDTWKTLTNHIDAAVERRIANCEKPTPTATTDPGVVINGIRWATRNVDAPGTFAPTPESAGKFYQWNRRKAWNATGNVTNWDSSIPTGTTWTRANDPSPAGWRVPTLAEIQSLLDQKKVRSEWTTVNGVNGKRFTDRATGNSLFLPAVGYRWHDDGGLGRVGTTLGFYRSSTPRENCETFARGLYFHSGNMGTYSDSRSYGFSVRSVSAE